MVADVSESKIYVLGGGLAGMAAAFQLASDVRTQREDGTWVGPRIILLEGQPELGGKARSFMVEASDEGNYFGNNRLLTDKGYHVFPFWYWDMWELLRRVGVVEKDEHDTCRLPDHCLDVGSPFTCPHDHASQDYTLISVLPDKSHRVSSASFRSPQVRAWIKGIIGLRATVLRDIYALARYGKNVTLMFFVMLGLVGAWPERLKRRTLEDHLSGRWYAGDIILERVREIVLKALANPSYDASAFTTANTYRRWLPVYLKANWRACRGPLGEELIRPFEAKLEELGVEIRKGMTIDSLVVEGDRMVEFSLAARGGLISTDVAEGDETEAASSVVKVEATDEVILALPHTVLSRSGLFHWHNPGSDTLKARRIFQDLAYIESAPMASLDLYLESMPFVPVSRGGRRPLRSAHFSLVESRYAITGFVASESWRDSQKALFPKDSSVLIQFVCSDAVTLQQFDLGEATEQLVEEIRRFIPSIGGLQGAEPPPGHEGLEQIPIIDAVLALNNGPADRVTRNDAGTWDRRPSASCGLENVHLAGDYCLCPVDVASMEAAVSTGMSAAFAVTADADYQVAWNLPVSGLAQPITAPMPMQARISYSIMHKAALLGGFVSSILGFILSGALLPNSILRSYALSGLRAEPTKRRLRDVAMMFAGLASLGLAIVAFLQLRSQIPSESWNSSLANGFVSGAMEGDVTNRSWVRATLIGHGIAQYLLLFVAAVPIRRFFPRSRGIVGGVITSGLGYLLLAFTVCEGRCVGGWWPGQSRLAAMAMFAMAFGFFWSNVSVIRDLKGQAAPFKQLRVFAFAYLPILLIGAGLMAWQALALLRSGDIDSWPIELLVLAAGHIWLASLSVFMVWLLSSASIELVGRSRQVSTGLPAAVTTFS